MKNILFFFVLASMLACMPEKATDTLIFSGAIENANSQGLVLSKLDYKKEIPVDENGAFKLVLTDVTEGIYTLWDSVESTSLYLIPGKDLHVTLNTEEFDESIEYDGQAPRASNYLAAKYLFEEARDLDYRELYKQDEAKFLEEINKLETEGLNFLRSVDSLPEKLVQLEKNRLKYEKLYLISNYGDAHAYLAKEPDFKVSEEFLKPLEKLNFNDERLFEEVESYRKLVIQHYSDGLLEDKLALLDSIQSEVIKQEVLNQLVYRMRPGSPQLDTIYETLSAQATDEAFKVDLVSKYEKYKTIAKGKTSPGFNYPDVDGEMHSLADFKGKLVYIDVWATWCGPCLAEIPYLKKLESDFHDKELAFVSISVDRKDDKEKWGKMVEEKDLKGYQLFSDKNWNSDFVVDYAIEGIPRFILVDQEGKIISPDAPRPSSEDEIRALIEQNL